MTVSSINSARLNQNLESLAKIGRTSDGAISRVAFSDADIEGRAFVTNLMQRVGFDVRVDEVGNIFGRRDGTDSLLSPILLGSHIDTVPQGGAFDGALGVLAAIEALQTINESWRACRHPMEVAVWSDEEGGLSGSRAFVGKVSAEELEGSVRAGMNLGQGIERIGGTPTRFADAECSNDSIAAYLELHIEQGGRLESEQLDIGVVTGIVGIRHYRVSFVGTPNHAGTTPMDRRKNALLAASDFVLAVDRVVRSIDGAHVGTVGELTVHPGAPNVIPGKVNLTVELRDLDSARIDLLWDALEADLKACERKHGVSADFEIVHQIPGVRTDRGLQDTISAVSEALELTFCLMPSGAGHDAQNLARITRAGMIFVPSVGGISHSRAENTQPKDVVNGAAVLLETLLKVDQELQ